MAPTYVGLTHGDSVEGRLYRHQNGALGGYTSTRRPVVLVWSEHFDSILDAISAERRIKGWSRAKKEALIRGDWDLLVQLAKRRGGKAESEE